MAAQYETTALLHLFKKIINLLLKTAVLMTSFSSFHHLILHHNLLLLLLLLLAHFPAIITSSSSEGQKAIVDESANNNSIASNITFHSARNQDTTQQQNQIRTLQQQLIQPSVHQQVDEDSQLELLRSLANSNGGNQNLSNLIAYQTYSRDAQRKRKHLENKLLLQSLLHVMNQYEESDPIDAFNLIMKMIK